MPPRPDPRQADLFFAYLVDLPLRDQADTMTLPVFSLGKGKRTKPITYDNGKVWIEVSAPPEIGIATVYDFGNVQPRFCRAIFGWLSLAA